MRKRPGPFSSEIAEMLDFYNRTAKRISSFRDDALQRAKQRWQPMLVRSKAVAGFRKTRVESKLRRRRLLRRAAKGFVGG